ncbi:hypothetical protein DYB26_004650 [Aphanomyces astaci]|uniref:tubulin-glutamate carboxypeptidase n=1 Tax=Aphanomyces astaci TaxID=112090 RepID=A0A397F1J4_APHAT|nr:hypothetical protein DYB31_000970 [Aphanomyces astaci]RHZ22045.1 hypothetical protein DYB26_004650 [Aphanomyces astaci]
MADSVDAHAAQHPARNEVLVDGLTFSSTFDSGNMLSVDRGRDLDGGGCEYVITAAPDAAKPDAQPEAPLTSTSWFHFSIAGASAGQVVSLQVVNLIKHSSLYDQDMRPVTRSLPSQKKWERRKKLSTLSSISSSLHLPFDVVRQGVTYQVQKDGEFSIRFTHTVVKAGETQFFAFCYPYSYTDLQRMLRRLDSEFSQDPQDGKQQPMPVVRSRLRSQPIYYHRETLAHSLDGRKVDLLTISSLDNILDEREDALPGLFPDHPAMPRPRHFQNKRVVFVTARVHPAETPASFVLEGVLSFLLKDDPRAHKLLKECVFKIIPMLNPDGVARGHYRHDSLGANLNRHYIRPTLAAHPTIFATKAAVLATCHTHSKLALHVDLHAHAAKRGCFIYGNRYDTMPEQAASQVYPKLVGLNSVHFEYDQCNFSELNMHLVEKRDAGLSKEGSARVALHRETAAMCPPVYFYTLECNYNMGRRSCSIPHSGSGLMFTAPLSPEVARKSYVPKYTTASWEDVGKGMMVAVLDWLGTNEWSRIPHSPFRTMAGLVQDIRHHVAPSFDLKGFAKDKAPPHVSIVATKPPLTTLKHEDRKLSKSDKHEMKRFGYVELPPTTTPKKDRTRSTPNNNGGAAAPPTAALRSLSKQSMPTPAPPILRSSPNNNNHSF